MNATKVYICGIISLLWFVNEILSIKVYENVTEGEKPPFTIDTSQRLSTPTATGATEITTLYLSAQATQKPTAPSEKLAKAQMYVAENQKIHAQKSMALKNIQVSENQRLSDEQSDKYTSEGFEKKDDKNSRSNTQQKWQIPSPISPLATTDPKAINSSKRQIENNGDSSYNLNSFVPSQELGPFEDHSGFVPHAYHQPKVINYVAPTYLPAKPIKHDTNINYGNFGEARLPVRSEGGLQSFENDFEDLKTKYPELNDLVSNYPIMEEIMKQKLAEKFKQNGNFQPQFKTTFNSFEDNSSAEKYNKFTSAENTQTTPVEIKYPSNSNEEGFKVNNNGFQQYNQFGKVHPYTFEQQKPNWSTSYKKQEQDIITTSETPLVVPAGGFYQDHKFPISPWLNNDDDKKYSSIESKPPSFPEPRPKKMVSPWKRILHMVTAFLPVGILISALTPSVVTISNIADKNYPIRQRSLNDEQSNPLKMSSPLLELIRKTDSRASQGDSACDDWQFCESIRKGKESEPSSIEHVYWKIAQDTPEQVAEKSGLKKLFKAAKSGDCSEFVCKRNLKQPVRRSPVTADLPRKHHDKTHHGTTEVYKDYMTNHTQESISRSGVLSRGKRTRSVRIM